MLITSIEINSKKYRQILDKRLDLTEINNRQKVLSNHFSIANNFNHIKIYLSQIICQEFSLRKNVCLESQSKFQSARHKCAILFITQSPLLIKVWCISMK